MEKTGISNGVKSKIKGCAQKAGIFLTSCYLGTYGAYCEVFTKAEEATDSITEGMVSLGKKIFPLAIIICVVALFVTHDERKLQMEIKIGIGLCVGYVLLLLASQGVIAETLETWFAAG